MHVLISGAGVAGPTLAWFLQKAGARVTIVEKAPTLLPHGQSVDIEGAAVTAIKKMGLLDQVRQFNTGEVGTRFVNSQGQPIAPFPVVKGSTASFSSECEILRGDLAAILYRATMNLPNVTYLFGTTVTDVISNNDETVKVSLSNGEVHEYDLLVAADGQWSRIRKQCFPAESVKVVDKNMYAVYWTIPRLPNDNDWWDVYVATKSRVITTRPDPHGTMRATFTYMPRNVTEKQAWEAASRGDRATQHELLWKTFADAGWEASRLLKNMTDGPEFYFQAIKQIKMEKWYSSRVICIGDAAFCPTPIAGGGTHLAITASYILAAELSKLRDGQHPQAAFEAYQNVFKTHVDQVTALSWFNPGFMHPGEAWKRSILHAFLMTLATIASMRGLMSYFSRDLEDNDDGFPLPRYPDFEDQIERAALAMG